MNTKLIWTSDPAAAKQLRDEGKLDERRDLPPETQTIRVTLDKKRRAGKSVTVASGFDHAGDSLTRLATQLKKRCGSGGTAKDREIEIQGDHVTVVTAELKKLGYRVK